MRDTETERIHSKRCGYRQDQECDRSAGRAGFSGD
jgi:hypothetical protein